MGTKVTPTYACLFIGWLENQTLNNWSKKQSSSKPYLWRRYIADIFFLWNGTTHELSDFLEHINTQHPNIKFTAMYDTETRFIPFLDMVVRINENGFLEMDLHKK